MTTTTLPSDFPTIQKTKKARMQLEKFILTTPVCVYATEHLETLLGKKSEIFCKLELLQRTGSFKPRGALLNMLDIPKDQLKYGVVAASAGNHAIAVSYAAKMFQTSATVVMPKHASPVRIAKCKAYGANVILVDDVAQGFSKMTEIQENERRYPIHPFEGPLVALGTATVGLELCQQVENLDAVIIPIGGGGLCAGIATVVSLLQPKCEIYGVEPEGANAMQLSFEMNQPQSISKVQTIADSLGAPYAMPYSFSLCRSFVDEIVTVSDEEMCRAMIMYFNDLKLAVEPAAAASLAALCGPLHEKLREKRVALIVSGTNIDEDRYCKYMHNVIP